MPTFAYTAANCPAVQIPATAIDPSDGVPTTTQDTVAGTTIGFVDQFNINAASIDLAGRSGGQFAHCVRDAGLQLTDGGGLTLNISAGTVGIDAGVYRTATTLAMTNNTTSHVWIDSTAAVAAVNGSTTPPAGRQCYLGRVVTSGGAITAIDYSGRVEAKGGLLWRRTGDIGSPGDSPSAAVQIVNHSQDGLYLWDGVSWQAMGGSSGLIPYRIVTGQVFYVPLNYEGQVWGTLQIDGSLQVAGKIRIVP